MQGTPAILSGNLARPKAEHEKQAAANTTDRPRVERHPWPLLQIPLQDGHPLVRVAASGGKKRWL